MGDTVTFLPISLTVFILLAKLMGWFMRTKQQEEDAPPPAPLTRDQELLM